MTDTEIIEAIQARIDACDEAREKASDEDEADRIWMAKNYYIKCISKMEKAAGYAHKR